MGTVTTSDEIYCGWTTHLRYRSLKLSLKCIRIFSSSSAGKKLVADSNPGAGDEQRQTIGRQQRGQVYPLCKLSVWPVKVMKFPVRLKPMIPQPSLKVIRTINRPSFSAENLCFFTNIYCYSYNRQPIHIIPIPLQHLPTLLKILRMVVRATNSVLIHMSEL